MNLNKIQDDLNSNVFVYLANDVYQGTGPELFLKNYHILTFDNCPLADLVRQNAQVFTIEEHTKTKNQTFRNSSNLSEFSCTSDYINSLPFSNKKIIIFKNSAGILNYINSQKWDVCASTPEIGRYFENKLKSSKYFKDLGLDTPKNSIIKAIPENINYLSISKDFGKKFVIQLAKGFGGDHTYIINSEKELLEVLPRIENREIKISEFIEGPTYTINACVTSKGIISSIPFLQITGVPECTKNKSGATGNQWQTDFDIPNDYIRNAVKKIGEFMQLRGYQGIFGLDIIINKNQKVYFIETNARLINSIPFYTQLQMHYDEIPLTAFHLLEFTGKSENFNAENYGENLKGAQIILHNLEDNPIEIKGNLQPGIYKFENEIFQFVKSSYKIADCINQNEILILPKELGRIVNPNMELGRIQTLGRLVDSNGEILPEFSMLTKKIYKFLLYRN